MPFEEMQKRLYRYCTGTGAGGFSGGFVLDAVFGIQGVLTGRTLLAHITTGHYMSARVKYKQHCVTQLEVTLLTSRLTLMPNLIIAISPLTSPS